MKLYPWQFELWQQLSSARARMPHALLLQGRQGVGKRDFAHTLAQSLLCDTRLPDHMPCGVCESCNWFQQGNHPDFRLLEPLDADSSGDDEPTSAAKAKKTQISVDQIRDLAGFLGLSSHRTGMRVVLLHPAEALNQASANALLKMLEEPPPGVLFLMVTHQPQRLLPTIRSRCNAIAMPVPDRPVAEAWLVEQGISQASQRLAYAGGSPLLVLQQDADGDRRLQDLQAMLMLGAQMDPFVTAGVCAREGMEWMVNALQKWVHDLVCTKLTRQFRYHLAWAEPLQGLAKRVDLPSLLDFQRTLDEARRHALHPLNTELQLESLLIQYTQIFTKRS